jgi:hypothetical protein
MMRLRLLGLVILLIAATSCAQKHATLVAPGPGAHTEASPTPQTIAWQFYLRINRGEVVLLSELESKLGPAHRDEQPKVVWTFRDSDDFLIVYLNPEDRATGAYWGLSYGAISELP